jgi:hypothetical protein
MASKPKGLGLDYLLDKKSEDKFKVMLCALCKNLEVYDKISLMPDSVRVWWGQYKHDAEQEKQRLRESAKAKLTKSERIAVGLEQ